MEIHVPTILDTPYTSIATHQDSWVAYEFVRNVYKFRKYYEEGNIEQFKNVYKECLLTGSKLRAKLGIKSCGENINNERLTDYYNDEKDVHHVLTDEIYKNYHLVPKDLPEELYNEYYNCNILHETTHTLEHILNRLVMSGMYHIVNRNQKSFTILPLNFHCKEYIVCNAYSPNVLVLNQKEMIEYILRDDTKPYLCILIKQVLYCG